MADWVSIVDHEGIIRKTNAACKNFTGKEPEEIVGKQICQQVFGSKEAIPDCPCRKVSRTKIRWSETVCLPGSGRWVQVTADAIIRNGDFAGFIHIVRDLSELKAAEEKARKAEEMSKLYLDIAQVILVALDASGRVTMINRKGCEVLGLDRKEIIGKIWFENFLPERLKGDVKQVFKTLVEGDIELAKWAENPIINAKGEERTIAWSNTVLRDESGKITGTLSSGLDVTEKKK